MTDNAIVHFDISGPSEDAVRSFYRDLLGWKVEAERLGGEVVMPPTDNGWVVKAQVRDPAGNVLTLIQQ